jgi:hypothetical protein
MIYKGQGLKPTSLSSYGSTDFNLHRPTARYKLLKSMGAPTMIMPPRRSGL